MKIRKAVLPVAGIGTRFLPATKVVPKELLPIVDKPVIQYLVEEAVASGIEEIIFVISKGKEAILEHFSAHPPLEEFLRIKGKKEILKKVEPIHRLAKFRHVYQEKPLGDGDALLKAEKLIGGEPFLVLFGDDIVKSKVPAAKQLIQQFKGSSVIGVEPIPRKLTDQYGIVMPGESHGRLHEVHGLVEKPKPEKSPSTLGIIGKYVCTPEIFDAIRRARPSHEGELRLIDGFTELLKTQHLFAYEIEGQRFDTGRPAGLIAAAQAYLDMSTGRI
jgi:UTP--glucose-1-phosphate uridylyltransferase